MDFGPKQSGWLINQLGNSSFLNLIHKKGRDSALGTSRKLSIIRSGATTVVAP